MINKKIFTIPDAIQYGNSTKLLQSGEVEGNPGKDRERPDREDEKSGKDRDRSSENGKPKKDRKAMSGSDLG